MNKTVFVAQIIITFCMALTMSGTLSAIMMGINAEWLAAWPKSFIIAWPIAFIYTQFISPFAFFVAGKLTGGHAPH